MAKKILREKDRVIEAAAQLIDDVLVRVEPRVAHRGRRHHGWAAQAVFVIV